MNAHLHIHEALRLPSRRAPVVSLASINLSPPAP